MLKKVVIIPGFSETASHFRELLQLLGQEGVEAEVIMPWRQKKLQANQDMALFISHSLGAYYASLYNLAPSILIGIPDRTLVHKNFGKSVYIIAADSVKNSLNKPHLLFRLMNMAGLFRYGLPSLYLIGKFYLSRAELHTDNPKIIVVRNTNDPLSQKLLNGVSMEGHHDDILYNPHRYLPLIKRLLK